MKYPDIGWIGRRDAIKAGIDNIWVQMFPTVSR
jgi:hypothetical protein